MNKLRSSMRGNRAGLSQSLIEIRRSGTGGSGINGTVNGSNFGRLRRQASERRDQRRSSGEADKKNDIEALKRNLIL